jgi:hypothetical protein
MASEYMGDALIITGKYTDNSGAEKNRYAKVGTWFKNENGNISVKIDILDKWVSLFDKKEPDNNQGGNQQNNNNQNQNQNQNQNRNNNNNNNNGGGRSSY